MSSLVQPPVRSEVHDVHPSTHQRLETWISPPFDNGDGGFVGRFFRKRSFELCFISFCTTRNNVPSDHDAHVWAVSGASDPISLIDPLLPQQGPGLVGGVITVDDESYTTQFFYPLRFGHLSTFGCVALLDTGSPQPFINARTWASMNFSGAASAPFEKRTPPRCWGGSVELLHYKCRRLSVEVCTVSLQNV